uniref:ZNF287-like protein n=1 Tax=Pantodon buchholzi TaxID=8276 RepID=A0A088FN02_PANBU|nr:ZNF287-like protein [Pantodon buchholzi]
MMNGALYISFFQGQLESALEQVVQLAVQEITQTVGASLNCMLVETTAKDRENQVLRLQLQPRRLSGGEPENASRTGAPTCGPGSRHHTVHTNAYRVEQKGRAVDQLKSVMEQVLKFALSELTKIVEDSFDELLLEMEKKEKENKVLKEKLAEKNTKEESPSGSPQKLGVGEHNEESCQETPGSQDGGSENEEQVNTTSDTGEKGVLSMAQNWVPILDKVFGQKWCSDLWQVKELQGGKTKDASLPSLDDNIPESLSTALLDSSEKVSSSLWVQPESRTRLSSSPDSQGVSVVSTTGSSPASVHISGAPSSQCCSGEDLQVRSPSMLHRLLTLPSQGLSQLLCSEDNVQLETLPVPLAAAAVSKEEEEDGDEPAGTLQPRAEEGRAPAGDGERGSNRKSYLCKQCGKRFGRRPLLKAHQKTHTDPPAQCSFCGKHFSQPARLQAHLRTHTNKNT